MHPREIKHRVHNVDQQLNQFVRSVAPSLQAERSRILWDPEHLIREMEVDLQATTRRLFEPNSGLFSNLEEMVELTGGDRHAVLRSLEVAERCGFSLDELKYEYPEELEFQQPIGIN